VALVALAGIGLVISAWLGAFQLGLIETVWDPVFGSASSERVLTSPVSTALPIPDAVLGAAGYALDIAIGLLAVATRRSVAILALAVLTAMGALVSVVLVVLQPLVAAAWCGPCLVSAAIAIVLAVGAGAEAHARLDHSGQFSSSEAIGS
jgi:uncharacterized membrane protein